MPSKSKKPETQYVDVDLSIIESRMDALGLSERELSRKSHHGETWYNDRKNCLDEFNPNLLRLPLDDAKDVAEALCCKVQDIQYIYREPYTRKLSDAEVLQQLAELTASPSESEQRNCAVIMELLERLLILREPKVAQSLDSVMEEFERFRANSKLPHEKRILMSPLYFSPELTISNALKRLSSSEDGIQYLADVLDVAQKLKVKSIYTITATSSPALADLFVSFGESLTYLPSTDADKITEYYSDKHKKEILSNLVYMIVKKVDLSPINDIPFDSRSSKAQEESYEKAMREILDQINGVDDDFVNEFIKSCSSSVLGYTYEPKK